MDDSLLPLLLYVLFSSSLNHCLSVFRLVLSNVFSLFFLLSLESVSEVGQAPRLEDDFVCRKVARRVPFEASGLGEVKSNSGLLSLPCILAIVNILAAPLASEPDLSSEDVQFGLNVKLEIRRMYRRGVSILNRLAIYWHRRRIFLLISSSEQKIRLS